MYEGRQQSLGRLNLSLALTARHPLSLVTETHRHLQETVFEPASSVNTSVLLTEEVVDFGFDKSDTTEQLGRNMKLCQVVVAHTFKTSTREQRWVEHCEFKASRVYKASSGTARAG